MAEQSLTLNHPWLAAVWPGMGNVALSAGFYLMSKLGMHVVAEYEAGELFDVQHIEVKQGLIQKGWRPRHRFYVWIDPNKQHDLVVFLGESQPPIGKYAFCERLIEFAKSLSVERVFTFAAMATQMHPEHTSRVFGAATDQASLDELKRLEVEVLQEGQISGLNGVLLAAAAEANMRGTCLLGEMPHIFSQLPFPKASLAILEVFTTAAGIELDLDELKEQARITEQQLGELLARVERSLAGHEPPVEEGYMTSESAEEAPIKTVDRDRIEELFRAAQEDRAKAFELKQTLDRLGIFKEYEDRFLDLFKKSP